MSHTPDVPCWTPWDQKKELLIATPDVHIWRVPLTSTQEHLTQLLAFLSQEERVRAARFRAPHARRSFIATRAALRVILASILTPHIAPAQITLTSSHTKKPCLDSKFRTHHPLEFNVSHSGAFSLIALRREYPVGVDVEQTTRRVDFTKLIPKVFAPGDRVRLKAMPDATHKDAFFRLWTRKEAYLKAIGMGLAIELHDVEVSLEEDDARLIHTMHQDAQPETSWVMHHLNVAPEYIGAIATKRPLRVIWTWAWDWCTLTSGE